MRAFPNPRPHGPRPTFHESSDLRSPRDSDSVARQWIKERAHARQGQQSLQNVQAIQRQIDRMRLRRGSDGFGSAGGIRWAKPKEFVPTKTYRRNQLVFVSLDNAAYLTGVSNGVDPEDGGAITGLDGFGADGDKAMAGLWCCIHSNRVRSDEQPPVQIPALQPNYDVHVPTWSPNMDVDDESEDSEGNYTGIYWVLIAFYPFELEVCVGGVPVPYYMHGHRVPQIELAGEGGGETIIGESGETIPGEGG